MSNRQLNDAFNGPYQHFIKEKLSAYALIAKLRLQVTVNQDESLKIKATDLDDTNKIPSQLVDKYSLADLEKMQSNLNELTKEHHRQWQDQLSQWNQEIISSLTAHDAPLTEIEIKELQDKEPPSELQNRLTELNLDTSDLNKADLNYGKFLKLKINLAIQSSLSRRHKPHTQTEINQIIKKMKPVFNSINQQEKKLIKKQKEETSNIVGPISSINNKS